MAAPKKNLPDIHRGDSRTFKMTFVDGDAVAIDISATVMWVTFKEAKSDEDADAVLQKDVTFPSDATSISGIGYLKLDPADTEVLTPGAKYWYDFQWVRAGTDEVDTMAWGQIKVLQDITQDVA